MLLNLAALGVPLRSPSAMLIWNRTITSKGMPDLCKIETTAEGPSIIKSCSESMQSEDSDYSAWKHWAFTINPYENRDFIMSYHTLFLSTQFFHTVMESQKCEHRW